VSWQDGDEEQRKASGEQPFGPPSTEGHRRLERVPFPELRRTPEEAPPSSLKHRGGLERARYRLRKVPALLEQLAERVRSPSYRSAGGEVQLHSSGCELELLEPHATLSVRLDHDGSSYRTSLKWLRRAAPASPDSWLARLTGSARRRRQREDARWAAALGAESLDGHEPPSHARVSVRRGRRRLSVDATSTSLPTLPWLTALVMALRERGF
jgi:hypothetical protein